MTEIPQHLLERSKKRRGGGGDTAKTESADSSGASGDGAAPAAVAAPAEPVEDNRIDAELELNPINGDPQSLEDWLLLFHLVVVVLDPYTDEAAWILPTAGKILKNFDGAGARVAFVVTADEADAAQFLGPWADDLLVFTDPDYTLAKGLEVESLPALVHIKQDRNIAGSAEGWQPAEWNEITKGIAKMLHWTPPLVPTMKDPPPFAGAPLHQTK